MVNVIHYTNIFGYSTTQLFTMLFPSQFFIYNYTKVLVSQTSFNTIYVYIYFKGFMLTCLFVINTYFVLEIFSESLFAVSQSITYCYFMINRVL